jgi:hypothetical protein
MQLEICTKPACHRDRNPRIIPLVRCALMRLKAPTDDRPDCSKRGHNHCAHLDCYLANVQCTALVWESDEQVQSAGGGQLTKVVITPVRGSLCPV